MKTLNNQYMNRPRVLVTEDDEFTRALVVNALQSEDFDVVLETSSATYALKTASRMKVDVALLDLDLGRGPTGLDLALGLRRTMPNIGIVFLTSFKDPRLLSSTSSMAPFGSVYLQKGELGDLSKLRRGLEKAIINGKTAHTKSNIDLKNLGNTTDLTNIQIDIIRLVAEGKSNQEIAAMREVTEKSIEQTLSRILRKAGIAADEKKNRRVELARYYLRESGVLRDEEV